MHTLVRRYIKTAIVFLILGVLLGGWMMVQRELRGRPGDPYLVSAHTHLLLVGFVMMMILGVALWMFPRPARAETRYRPAIAELAYWLITAGTSLRAVGECLRGSGNAHAWLRVSVTAAGLAQIVGLILFFATMWGRIRPAGSRAREASGERF